MSEKRSKVLSSEARHIEQFNEDNEDNSTDIFLCHKDADFVTFLILCRGKTEIRLPQELTERIKKTLDSDEIKRYLDIVEPSALALIARRMTPGRIRELFTKYNK